MAKLSDEEVQEGLRSLPGWRREGDEIVRDFDCESFPAAIEFVTRIADVAEAADHHPDIDIRWKKLKVALTTHDSGGLTRLDLDVAAKIDASAPAGA